MYIRHVRWFFHSFDHFDFAMSSWSVAPLMYRAATRAMFARFGGLDALRLDALDAIELRRGARVLELGCGSGDVTAALVARSAAVHAVDRSPAMLRDAAIKAPQASFEQADLRTYVPRHAYDVVLLAFVLHELPVADVQKVIERAAAALTPGGCVAVLDHAVPPSAAGWHWRALLRVVESRTIASWLALDLHDMLRRSGLSSTKEEMLAAGRVRLVIARRGPKARRIER